MHRHDKIKNNFCDDEEIMLYRVKSFKENDKDKLSVFEKVEKILKENELE